jgi:hypothetical protein
MARSSFTDKQGERQTLVDKNLKLTVISVTGSDGFPPQYKSRETVNSRQIKDWLPVA